MANYWITNVALSLLMLAALPLLRTAPPRLKMWLSLGAVAAWYVPWSALSSLLSSGDMIARHIKVEAIQTLAMPAIAPSLSGALFLQWGWIAVGASALGLVLFVTRIVVQQLQFRSWRHCAVPAPELWRRAGYETPMAPLFIVDGLENAFVSGYFRPRIWLGRPQAASPALASILRHELVHARHHDNLILLFATLSTDLLWWNPLVHWLVRHVRRNVELSCDLTCKRSSPTYQVDIASELLSRQYRMMNSRLVSPMSWNQGFNAYRVRQLAKEISMKTSHFCVLSVILLVSVVFIANVALSQEATASQKIINNLTVTTIEGNDKRKAVADFIGEPEFRKMLHLARNANVTIDVHKAGEFRRVIAVNSTDMAETRKVLAAFENTPMEKMIAGIVTGESGASMLLDLKFEATDQSPYSVTLAPGDGQWAGVTVGDYLLRMKLDREGLGEKANVIVAAHISRIGDQSYELISSPSLTTEMGKEAVIQVGSTENMFTLKLLPRPLSR